LFGDPAPGNPKILSHLNLPVWKSKHFGKNSKRFGIRGRRRKLSRHGIKVYSLD
jgi:hypothetical protein